MKLPFFDIEISRASNVKKERERLIERLVSTQQYFSRKNIQDWKDASDIAESHSNPNRVQLMEIFKRITLDAHLHAVMTVIKSRISSIDAFIVDQNGEPLDVDLSSIKWFRDLLNYAIESKFYGYSLCELMPYENDATTTLVPRHHVVPSKRIVRPYPYSDAGAISVDDPMYSKTLILFDDCTLGLLHKVAPLILMKSGVLSAWSEYAELFGMPIRIGRTDIRNPQSYKNMSNMLVEMGSASSAVLDKDDLIEFIETSKGDAFNVYDRLIANIDAQVSKMFLGQTGTTDEKAYSGSANVHSQVLDAIISSYLKEIESMINKEAMPKILSQGLLLNGTFKFMQSKEMTNEEKLLAVEKLAPHFTIPTEWISEQIGVPVEEKKLNVNYSADMQNKVNKLYGKG